MHRPGAEDPLDIAKRHGQRPGQQRGARAVLPGHSPVPVRGDELLQPLDDLRADGGGGGGGGGTGVGVEDEGAGADAGGEEEDVVELVEEEDGVEEGEEVVEELGEGEGGGRVVRGGVAPEEGVRVEDHDQEGHVIGGGF